MIPRIALYIKLNRNGSRTATLSIQPIFTDLHEMANINDTNSTNGVTNGAHDVQHAKALGFDTFRNVVNGKLVDTKSHRQGIKPATSEPHVDVPVSTEADLDDAVYAAREAFKSWSQTTLEERKSKVLAYADALEAEKEGFVKLLTTEQGKPVRI